MKLAREQDIRSLYFKPPHVPVARVRAVSHKSKEKYEIDKGWCYRMGVYNPNGPQGADMVSQQEQHDLLAPLLRYQAWGTGILRVSWLSISRKWCR